MIILKYIKFVLFVFKVCYFYIFSLGISRALSILVEADDRKKLKTSGFLTRNSLCKERRSVINYLIFNSLPLLIQYYLNILLI